MGAAMAVLAPVLQAVTSVIQNKADNKTQSDIAKNKQQYQERVHNEVSQLIGKDNMKRLEENDVWNDMIRVRFA